MNTILSARVDSEVAESLARTAQRLGRTKKQVIEDAIRKYAEQVAAAGDILEETCGAWKRKQSAATVLKAARRAFRSAMLRHHP